MKKRPKKDTNGKQVSEAPSGLYWRTLCPLKQTCESLVLLPARSCISPRSRDAEPPDARRHIPLHIRSRALPWRGGEALPQGGGQERAHRTGEKSSPRREHRDGKCATGSVAFCGSTPGGSSSGGASWGRPQHQSDLDRAPRIPMSFGFH